MIPETNEANEIRLYQAVNFPLKWKLNQVLMRNVSAVDTVVYQDNNIWYMLTNICSSCSDDHSSELHIFYSDHLLNHNWKPHSNNPVIIDSLKGRNAGLIIPQGITGKSKLELIELLKEKAQLNRKM